MTRAAVLVLRVSLVMASWIAAMRITATLKGGYTSLNYTFGENEEVLTDDSSVHRVLDRCHINSEFSLLFNNFSIHICLCTSLVKLFVKVSGGGNRNRKANAQTID